jgi:hypothetical protein
LFPWTIVFLRLSLVNYGPDTAFATWFCRMVCLRKNWSELFMWDPWSDLFMWDPWSELFMGIRVDTSVTSGRQCMYRVYAYLSVLNYLRFPRDLLFRVVDICVRYSVSICLRERRAWELLHNRLKICVISIWRPRNVRFSVFTIRHLSSRIKFM